MFIIGSSISMDASTDMLLFLRAAHTAGLPSGHRRGVLAGLRYGHEDVTLLHSQFVHAEDCKARIRVNIILDYYEDHDMDATKLLIRIIDQITTTN